MVFILDIKLKRCYKYTCNVEANQRRTGPGGGTRRLHHKHIMVLDEGNWCAYDGVEIGSTGVRENVELPVGDDRKSSKTRKWQIIIYT